MSTTILLYVKICNPDNLSRFCWQIKHNLILYINALTYFWSHFVKSLNIENQRWKSWLFSAFMKDLSSVFPPLFCVEWANPYSTELVNTALALVYVCEEEKTFI